MPVDSRFVLPLCVSWGGGAEEEGLHGIHLYMAEQFVLCFVALYYAGHDHCIRGR